MASLSQAGAGARHWVTLLRPVATMADAHPTRFVTSAGHTMPAVALGVYDTEGQRCYEAVLSGEALEHPAGAAYASSAPRAARPEVSEL